MRYKLWHIGDCRRRSGFLLWPKRIGDERRWLEWATWIEQRSWLRNAWGDTFHGWKAVEWVDCPPFPYRSS
jgi:hypothetical protein